MYNFNATLPSSDIAKIGESVFGETTTTLPETTIYNPHTSNDMGKKKFLKLIKRASQPAPKEPDTKQ